MKLRFFVIGAISLAALFSCAGNQENKISEPKLNPEVQIINSDIGEENVILGELTLKLTPDLAAEVEAMSIDGKADFAKVKALRTVNASLGVVSARRLFPEAGEFEERTRAEGLHLWYLVEFDENQALTKASKAFSQVEGISIIEFNPRIKIVGNPVVTEYVDIEAMSASATPNASAPFNDPLLPHQWHYYNEGTVPGSLSGCDINVFPVWRTYTTGKSDVVVAVVDGGIDFTHEDLADNMWHNPEKNGDQAYGYNFINNGYTIIPHDHGTHVAGTVAAVNNNGIGVSGVAGGNKAKGISGIKLMSCQIFDNSKKSGSGSEAIKWACDHGAVIAQNSWGYTNERTTPASLIAAVEYFNKYAGLDKNNKQVGPMRGGIVIFSAGNENVNYSGNSHSSILSVASVGADYKKAYYSCYGDWVGVAAPGGDVQKGNQVLSTLPDGRYGYMQGTSMACPHVSGVAALIVSHFGGQGFTGEELRAKIENNTTDISSFNRIYYIGKGLVNVYKAIAGSSGVAPDKVTNLKVETQSNNVNFSLTIPADTDDGKPNTIILYYDTKPITDVKEAMFTSFYVQDLNPGDTLKDSFGGLEFETTYYITAVASDLSGNKSDKCEVIEVKTGKNTAPFINALSPTKLELKPHERAQVKFEFGDVDGHYCTLSLEKGSEAEILDTLDFSKPKLDIIAVNAPTGDYSSRIIVSDVYGATSALEVQYTILENHPPVAKKAIEDMIIGQRNQTIKLNASEYIFDEDDEPLNYTITNTNESVANVNYNKGELFITSLNYGYADIKIVAKDAREATAEQNFKILVRDSKEPTDVYPNPVSDYLYVRTSTAMNAKVELVNTLGVVVYSAEHSVSAFNPAKIDVRDLSAGVYTIVIDNNSEKITKTVVKL